MRYISILPLKLEWMTASQHVSAWACISNYTNISNIIFYTRCYSFIVKVIRERELNRYQKIVTRGSGNIALGIICVVFISSDNEVQCCSMWWRTKYYLLYVVIEVCFIKSHNNFNPSMFSVLCKISRVAVCLYLKFKLCQNIWRRVFLAKSRPWDECLISSVCFPFNI